MSLRYIFHVAFLDNKELNHLVASPASSAQVVMEKSTDMTEVTFSVFLAGLVSSISTKLISLTFTVSSVVLEILIAAMDITFLPLLLSLLGLYIGVG